MKTLRAAAALATTGAVTVQAADTFTCGALGYAMHDGRVERVCPEGDGGGRAVRDGIGAAGQSAAFSIPRAAGEAPERVVLTNGGGHLHIAEPPAAVSGR